MWVDDPRIKGPPLRTLYAGNPYASVACGRFSFPRRSNPSASNCTARYQPQPAHLHQKENHAPLIGGQYYMILEVDLRPLQTRLFQSLNGREVSCIFC